MAIKLERGFPLGPYDRAIGARFFFFDEVDIFGTHRLDFRQKIISLDSPFKSSVVCLIDESDQLD